MLVGRFAPTPSGRMHLGNLFSALLAWLSVRAAGGQLVLRIEDLDRERCSDEAAQTLREDLRWLGLTWDWEAQPQSQRDAVYARYLDKLSGLLYPCYCTRGDLKAASAPHAADGKPIYAGTCRHLTPEERAKKTKPPCMRLIVPDEVIAVHDGLQGDYAENLLHDCGDFIVRRADGVFAYQLAVVVDDGENGVTQVVRGRDLLDSVPRQMYLQRLLGLPTPEYYHVPLLVAPEGRRLSKRDGDLDLGALRLRHTAPEIIGYLAHRAGLLERDISISAAELVSEFDWGRVCREDIVIDGAF